MKYYHYLLSGGYNEYIGVVIYENGQYVLDNPEKKISISDCLGLGTLEVIGNIYMSIGRIK